MSRLTQRFAAGKLLIPYIMGGWPDLAASKLAFKTFAELGCPVVEIGIPYSDPVADGPTIQRASEAALAAGTNTDQIFDMIADVRAEIDVSPVLMVYYNLIYRYGLERFAAKAKEVGVEGVIVPDLSIEESDDWRSVAGSAGIDTIFLVAPTSSDERLTKIAEKATGFIYAVSLTGVTGARAALPDDLKDFVGRVKSKTTLPVAVGFGISEPEQARDIAGFADGIIVGSAIIDIISATSGDERTERLRDFGGRLLSAIKL